MSAGRCPEVFRHVGPRAAGRPDEPCELEAGHDGSHQHGERRWLAFGLRFDPMTGERL